MAEATTRLESRAREEHECARQFAIAEQALEQDYKYARNWTDAWYVTGASLIGLGLTNDFLYKDYRLSEAITFTALGALLMIQVPTATFNKRALDGIRASSSNEPCLALNSAKHIFEVNAHDADDHQSAFAYIFPVALNVVAGGILALSTQHWDFAGHGAEGLSVLVGIVAGELQVLTYPRPSLKHDAPAISLQFTGTGLRATF